MPLTPGWDKRNLLPNMLGLNENHSLEGAQGGRNKNKEKGNREEGGDTCKVPSSEVAALCSTWMCHTGSG